MVSWESHERVDLTERQQNPQKQTLRGFMTIREFIMGTLDCMKRAVLFALWVLCTPFIAIYYIVSYLVDNVR